ncbi:SEFIR domain-containing protein [Rhizobium sp. PP-CC-3G-465]|uniref:SEFIR domain-containing protein n=1 Tax=Rhizobium sp. PP-CC-3G-465 TaxID=2135648 RepID=UPI00104E05F9|nr:SEFIR domain-containing protein [Rhizobium sp. PP-CC-3G-465]
MSETRASEPKLFISYSWTTSDHEAWVLQLAEELTSQGIHVLLDKWDLQPGHDANVFMEGMVSDPTVTKVLLVCDEMYATKSDGRKGGAGTEAQIITPEIYTQTKQDKFAAVVRERDSEGKAFLPVYYRGRIYFDLTDPSTYSTEFDKIVRWAWGQQPHVRPAKGERPSFLEGKTISGKIVSSAAHRRAMEAVRSGAANSVPAVQEYLDLIAAGLEAFRIHTEPATRQTFDDFIVASIEEFTSYRNEIIELFSLIAQYSPVPEYLEVIRRFFEKCILYFEFRGEGSYNDWDFDNYRFIVHELFLYCVCIFIRYERFPAAQEFLDNEYYWDDRRGRDNKMHSFSIFRTNLRSLEHRNQRLRLQRLSVRADLLKQRNVGTGVDFNHVMTADFLLYLRSAGAGRGYGWWPETLVYAERFSGPFEIFARAKSLRYFDKIKGMLNVQNKAELEKKLTDLIEKELLPRWQFDTLNVEQLTGFANIGVAL